jgi:hypothetical protein
MHSPVANPRVKDPDNATPADAAYAKPLLFIAYDSFYLLLACFSSLIVRSGSVTILYRKETKSK